MKQQYRNIFVLASIMLLAVSAAAQDGALDLTFNTTGIVTTPIGPGIDIAKAIAIQSDGKIVVAGYSHNGVKNDFAVVRYTSTGTLDATFGTGGKVTTGIGTFDDEAYGVAVQSDGKIVAVGYYNIGGGSGTDFVVVRYTSTGTLDATFGAGGIVATAVGDANDIAYAVAIQSDGKIVVAGYAEFFTSAADFAVVRYTSTGTLDATFGTGGKVTTAFGNNTDIAYAVAIQSDGMIVLAGGSMANNDFVVARYTSAGALDASFDTDGIVTTAIGSGSDVARAVAIQGDGKIVVVGQYAGGAGTDIAVVRYTSTGTLDSGFDGDGIVTTPIGSSNEEGYAVALQLDGKIVVAGQAIVGLTPANYDFAALRYTSTGTLDATFGTGGIVTTAAAVGSDNDYGQCVAIQSDGKIVVAGYTSGTNNDFAVVRYTGSSAPLPVELASFSAQSKGNGAKLVWTTATEVNNDGFEIERRQIQNSNFEIRNWSRIGFVSGSGTVTSPHQYSFIDQNLSPGLYAYRLKQIDRTGKSTYSHEMTVEVGMAPKVFSLDQNYPNPFNPTTTIEFSVPEDGRAVLKIVDLLGREVATLFEGESKSGYYQRVVFDATKFASGVYFSRLEFGGKQQMKKMVLMK